MSSRDFRVGTSDLQIPKLRVGSYFPSLLEPRRRHERALLSVVQEAYINGVSIRTVDQLAEALGLKGISKDQVSRICRELDGQVTAFRYFGKGGCKIVSASAHVKLTIAETANRKSLLEHLRLHNQGKMSYLEMSKGLADSGGEKCTFCMNAMTIADYDAVGNEIRVEAVT